jgi:hypothetical protein
MKYEITKNTMTTQGAQTVGSVVELSADEARQLMAIGRIKPYDESQIVDRSVGLAVSEEKVVRRGRPKKTI